MIIFLGGGWFNDIIFEAFLCEVNPLFCYTLYTYFHYMPWNTGFFKKNSHPPTCCHIIPDPPAPPWSMLLPNACRHPNRNGCFFWRPFEAKRCNNIELGERGHASFFAMSLTGWLFFLKNPDSVRERFFGLRMCKHKLEQTTFCTCHNLNPNTLSSSKLLPSKQRSTIFFCLWLCKRKLEQIPFCTCHNPNPKTRSSSQLLPTNKECASTPPEAELHKLCFAQCTYSARTVHGTVHATVHGHKTL